METPKVDRPPTGNNEGNGLDITRRGRDAFGGHTQQQPKIQWKRKEREIALVLDHWHKCIQFIFKI